MLLKCVPQFFYRQVIPFLPYTLVSSLRFYTDSFFLTFARPLSMFTSHFLTHLIIDSLKIRIHYLGGFTHPPTNSRPRTCTKFWRHRTKGLAKRCRQNIQSQSLLYSRFGYGTIFPLCTLNLAFSSLTISEVSRMFFHHSDWMDELLWNLCNGFAYLILYTSCSLLFRSCVYSALT